MNELFKLGRITEETMGTGNSTFWEPSGETCTSHDSATTNC
jgi:hypothetical protein